MFTHLHFTGFSIHVGHTSQLQTSDLENDVMQKKTRDIIKGKIQMKHKQRAKT